MKQLSARLNLTIIKDFFSVGLFLFHNKVNICWSLTVTYEMDRSDGESDACSTSTRDSRCSCLASVSWSGTSEGDCQSVGNDYDQMNVLKLDDVTASSQTIKRRNTVSLDCEMVGVGAKKRSALARCSVVDYQGKTLFDHYVKPKQKITDYRTKYSGIKPSHMKNALSFNTARRRIKNLLRNKILVGHALHMDMKVLGVHMNSKVVRDTSKFPALRILSGLPVNCTPSLRNLSRILLGRTIQAKSHCSVEDATAALDLYKFVEEEWEQDLDARHNSRKYLDDKFWPPWVGI